MAFCANCGTEMSDQAAACPKCGHPTFTPRTVRRTEGSAVAALVLGVLGIVACPLVLSIPAVIVGTQAKAKIAADPTLDGEPLARVGVILGWVGIGLAALGILIFVLVLSFGSRTVGPTF
jgi:hypothetical protein